MSEPHFTEKTVRLRKVLEAGPAHLALQTRQDSRPDLLALVRLSRWAAQLWRPPLPLSRPATASDQCPRPMWMGRNSVTQNHGAARQPNERGFSYSQASTREL